MQSLKNPSLRGQNGQTLAIVAVSMISLLAMAALAVDLASLYSARSEVQRAADATALAGAKAFVDSGVTTDPTNPNLQNLAQTMAVAYANGAAAQNTIAGGTAAFLNPPIIDFSLDGNPRITVTLQRTGLPLFFARIWGGKFGSVSATAIAEAYNPSYSQANTNSFIPSAPKCVKPFLVPNNDNAPGLNAPIFVDPSSGAVEPSGLAAIGQPLNLDSACGPGNPNTCKLPGPPNNPKAIAKGTYLPMAVSGTHQFCPNQGAPGCSSPTSDFQQSIQCCDGSVFSAPQCGTGNSAAWNPSINPRGGGANGPVQSGLQCLIHTTQGGAGQDTLDPSNFLSGNGPMMISPGPYSQSRYGLSSATLIATSDSIIVVPVFDNSNRNLPQNLNIVGFLQLFVNDVTPAGTIDSTVMNISGCGQAVPGPAVSGGGVSTIPVRLVRQ